MNIYNVCNKREEDYEKEVRPCDGGCADGFILSSLWWFFIVFPYINLFMLLLMLVELGKCFGRFKIWEEGMAAVLPFVFFPVIAKNDAYQDPATAQRPKKSAAREWFDAIIFAVVAALIIRTYVIEMFQIPTSSMEKSLCVGDYLIVSKIHYGPKRPNTYPYFPFVHNTLPGSKTKKCNFKFVINMSESTTMNITGKINPAKFTGKGSKGISSLKASVNGTDSSGEYLESLKSQLVYLVNCCLTMNDYMLLGKYSSKDLGFDKYEPIVEGAN